MVPSVSSISPPPPIEVTVPVQIFTLALSSAVHFVVTPPVAEESDVMGEATAIPSAAADWIEQADARNSAGPRSAYKTALLLLAAGAVAGKDCLIAPEDPVRSTTRGPDNTVGEIVP